MIRSTETPPPQAGPAALAAAALTVTALALLMTYRTPAPAPATPSVKVSQRAAPASLHTVRYYPEQLAALQSLSSFQPIADAGEKPAPARLPPLDAKPARRAESSARPIAAAAPQTAAAAAAAPAAESGARILGLSLPAGFVGGVDLGGLRDAAGGWGAALGAKVAGLWR